MIRSDSDWTDSIVLLSSCMIGISQIQWTVGRKRSPSCAGNDAGITLLESPRALPGSIHLDKLIASPVPMIVIISSKSTGECSDFLTVREHQRSGWTELLRYSVRSRPRHS